MPEATTPNAIRLNLNDTIRFRLTPKGVEVYDAHFRAVGMEPPPLSLMLHLDAEGWCSTQLWSFCNIFGSAMFMGAEVPVETAIEVIPSP